MSCKVRNISTGSYGITALAAKLDNIKIVTDVKSEQIPTQNGKLVFDLGTNALYMSLNGRYVPTCTSSGSTSSASQSIPVVSFGSALPQTNAASALATIVDPAKNPIAVVHDVDKGDVVLHIYTPTGWLSHRDVGTNNHFDFSTYPTKTAADSAAASKNPNDLVYVSGDKALYYIDANKHLVPIVATDTSNLATKTELAGKQDNVGFALVDIDGDGNDDVYNKFGHKLMLTDSSGHVIPVTHEGQAIPKKHLDTIVGTLASLLTTNKGSIVDALNELFNTGTKLNADIQSKLKHLTSAEHIVEYNTGNPSDPVTSQAALATITTPTEDDKALLIDKTANKSRLEFYHNGAWITLTDDVGGNVDLSAYQTTAQADSKYATKTETDDKYVPKVFENYTWKGTGSGNLTKVENMIHSGNTAVQLNHDSHNYSIVVGDYAKTGGSYSLTQKTTLRLTPNEFNLHLNKPANPADIVVDAKTDVTKIHMNASNVEFKTENGNITAINNTGNPYITTVDAGIVTKKLLDSKQPKLLPTPSDTTAESALLVEANIGSIYEVN